MRNYLFLLVSLAAMAAPGLAEPGKPTESFGGVLLNEDGNAMGNVDGSRRLPEDEITVLASGQWMRIDDTGQTIGVLDDAELRSVQGPDLTRALRRLPGVTLTRNGGLGGFTGLRVRGSASEQVLVLADGVRVNDPSSPGGGFDFGSVAGESLERVELLRGSNSVIWGSDAIGGVVNLSTRQIGGVEVSAEYGGDEQFSGNFALGHDGDAVNATLAGGYINRQGFSSSASGNEPDGYEQYYLTAKGDWRIAPSLTLLANARFAEGKLDIDGFPPPLFAFTDTAERQDTREISGRIGFLYDDDDRLTLRGTFAHAGIDRDLIDEAFGPAPYYATKGRSHRAELFGRYRFTGELALDAGADAEWSRFSDGFTRAKAEIASVHGLLGWYGEGLSIAGGARYDHHDRFGGEVSLGANASVFLASNLRLRASYGEGFKAPTLFQLHSDFGNVTLRPERSRSVDFGIDIGERDSRFKGSLTLFRRDSRDLIDFVSCFGMTTGICNDRPFGTYDNVGKARAQGVELELAARLGETLRASASYSYIETRDRTPGAANRGNWLARRPPHALSASLDWTSPVGVVLGGDLRLVGESFDDAGNFTRIDGHAIADLRASWPVSERIELHGRIENVTDAAYVEVAGYSTQGRAAYIGARARF